MQTSMPETTISGIANRVARALLVLAMLILALPAGSASAQSPERSYIAGGRFGPSVHQLAGDGVDEAERVTGWTAGSLFLGYRVRRGVTLQAEAVFNTKGADDVRMGRLRGTDAAVDYKFVYLDVPLLAKLTYEDGGLLAPGVFGGVAPSVLLSGVEDSGDPSAPVDEARRFDVGLVAGVELGLKVGDGSGKLVLDLRLTQGVLDVFDAEGAGGMRNRAFAFTWGVAQSF